ncbi:hypothetical protein N7466_004533 [Penicillium verhagenii]|uniref:uncharacterized protein n=1 Tax=Penicillium verhagenii TaxID=1562060 RepID=UPI002545BD47|nr:uncharacterized protein N7466_004533 [Penicillium verhagenii]KAJ5934986.1 hypothetical protein N7466_004533 [Penicillium verhagenii]
MTQEPVLSAGHDEDQLDEFGGLAQSSAIEQPPPSARREIPHFENIPISVRGIVLVSKDVLPDRYRELFPFPLFNAVQSRCFEPAYNSDSNLVLSSPTGSGKTVIMELAICRLLNVLRDERFKVVYQAPTKSLCTERFKDWNTKFATLNLKCAELTGDTDYMQLRSVQNSQIIITTPEKWDSMTRKWQDHMKLLQLVKLFLLDEVHFLKESRGATLEAVVSRMKNIGSNVRFIALSATIPNSEDIATWLGRDATNQHIPAHREHFGEDFRPVKLQKFVYGYQSSVNDFAFDKICMTKLPDIIGTHSCKKPIMIFSCTRNSCVATAKELARLWDMTNPPSRLWKCPTRPIQVNNEDLNTTISAGVAFHHAGLGPSDRHAVEQGFLDGHINVICCTSTLAVGVNLPCHLVIIKNTVSWQDGGCKEYSDLEMTQMLGRAGRPQFDDSAVAVILTRKERVPHYERLVSGTESIESCLHLNLIDHINAEIGLGNVTDIETAIKWLAGTFLFVRLRRNPTHYKLKEGASQEDEDELLRQICEKDINLLQECGLVETESLRSTPYGNAMARYYIRFETMKVLLSLKEKASLQQILGVIVQAEEFREIRFKAGEKSLYKEINRDQGIRFPITVDIALTAHKITLLLQSELGALDFPCGDQFQKFKFSLQQDKSLVFAHVNRLVRCVVDCLIEREDSVSILNALDLARSVGAKVWDQSPLQMKQIEQIGVVAVRKLVATGVSSIEELECMEAHEIEMTLSRNPPFGTKLLSRLKEFPKLRIEVKLTSKEVKNGSVTVRFKFEVAFMNEKIPTYFSRRPVYVCCLTETSDGRLIDFRRFSAIKLQSSMEIALSASMSSPDQRIVCRAMCDDIAGTARQAELKLDVSAHLPTKQSQTINNSETRKPEIRGCQQLLVVSKRKSKATDEADIFDDDDFAFDDFLFLDRRERSKKTESMKQSQVEELDWLSIDNSTPSPERKAATSKAKGGRGVTEKESEEQEENEPVQLANGNWSCNHRCKDKTRDGLEKPPKTGKKRVATTQKVDGLNQLTLKGTIAKKDIKKDARKEKGKAVSNKRANQRDSPSPLRGGKKPKTSNTASKHYATPSSSKYKSLQSSSKIPSSDHDDDDFSDFPSPSEVFKDLGIGFRQPPSIEVPDFGGKTKSFIDLTTPSSYHSPDIKPSSGALAGEFPSTTSTSPGNNYSFALWEDPSPSPKKDAFPSPVTTKSSSTTVHLPELSETLFHPEQQETYLAGSQLLTDTEKPDWQEFDAPLAVECDKQQVEPGGSPGWEDIDRLLLEEFKNVVDFY